MKYNNDKNNNTMYLTIIREDLERKKKDNSRHEERNATRQLKQEKRIPSFIYCSLDIYYYLYN